MFEENAGGAFLHFRAGRMTYANGVVTPDTRRGDLSFTEVGNTVELVWTSHATVSTICLPKGKTKVSFVDKCKTGRVLLFEVTDSDTPTLHFFWMQDKSSAEDGERLTALQNALKASEPVVKMADFVKIMERIPVKKEEPKGDVHLSDVIFSPQAIEAMNNDCEFFLSKLSKHLPEDKSSTLTQQVNNPQVRAATLALEATLKDPAGFNEICRSYNLPESKKCGVLAFVQLIIDESKKK